MLVSADTFGNRPVLWDVRTLAVGHSFADLGCRDLAVSDLDRVAFWQSLIFDYPLGLRTLNKNVRRLPGGMQLNVDQAERGYSIVGELPFVNSAFSTTPNTAEVLNEIDARFRTVAAQYWEEAGSKGRILLPLSGGLDSRLSAAYLATTGNPERMIVVTYAFSKKSMEYRYAAAVCKELGVREHLLHLLPRTVYATCVADFWQQWQGMLSVMHSHLYSFLRSYAGRGDFLVSGFFADAVAGYMARESVDPGLPLEMTSTYRRVVCEAAALCMEDEWRDLVIQELKDLYEQWREGTCHFNFDEFIYLSQKQSAFFSVLGESLARKIKIRFPFADPILSTLFLSAAPSLRKNKMILRQLLKIHFPTLYDVGDVSSSFGSHSWQARLSSWQRKWSGRLSVVLPSISNDYIRWVSAYATEDLFGAMRVENRDVIKEVAGRLVDREIISELTESVLVAKSFCPFRTKWAARLLTMSGWKELAPISHG